MITNLHKNKILDEAVTGVQNMQESAHREALYFVRVSRGELLDERTGEPLSDVEINLRLRNWLMSLDSVRARLRYFRDVTLPAYPDLLQLAALRGITPEDLEGPAQLIGALLDDFKVKVGYDTANPEAVLLNSRAEVIEYCLELASSAAIPPSIWDNPLE